MSRCGTTNPDCVVVPDDFLDSGGGQNYFKKVRGSDPRAVTCRGKLQFQRSKLNQEINKQILLRNGAEKLYKASTNKKMRESVALELNFVNSNLQLLKEQLAELNSSVHVYQKNNDCPAMPMIPLGLKETKYINFKEPFQDFILEHYSEDGKKYEKAIEDFTRLRQAARTPKRDQTGIQLLLEYYNLLYYVDHRFFPPHRNMGIYFEWFDSLTGIPAVQKTVAYEKACILFNVAALHTQIGSNQDRTSSSGLDAAVDSFLRAAGMFRYIRDNFSNPPSTDLAPETLTMLTHLMLSQARECLLEKFLLLSPKFKDLEEYLDIAQETAELCEKYKSVCKTMSLARLKHQVPYPWVSLAQVKAEHYGALAHRYVAEGILSHPDSEPLTESTKQLLEFIHTPSSNRPQDILEIKVPKNAQERRHLGRCHLREAVERHEEALRLHRMCRQLHRVDSLQDRLRTEAETTLSRYLDLAEEEDSAIEDLILESPVVQPSTKFQLTLTTPDFGYYKVKDLFHGLGPIQVFSARKNWSAPKTVLLKKELPEESFGIAVVGDAPVRIAAVEGLALEAGLKEGDYIVAIGDKDTKWSRNKEVAGLIRAAGDELAIKVVTPSSPDHHKSGGSSTVHSVSSASTSSSSSGSNKRLSWNLFTRRSRSRERGEKLDQLYKQNIFLRRSITDLHLHD